MSCWTDKQSRLEARLTWKQLPKSARQQAIRLARRGRLHPDPRVRVAASDLSNSWFFEFTAGRIAVLTGGLLTTTALATILFRLPPTAAVGLVTLVLALFAGTGLTAANLRRVSGSEPAVVDSINTVVTPETLVGRLRTLRHPMSLLGLVLLVLGAIGPSPLLAALCMSGVACLFLGVGVMPTRELRRGSKLVVGT